MGCGLLLPLMAPSSHTCIDGCTGMHVLWQAGLAWRCCARVPACHAGKGPA